MEIDYEGTVEDTILSPKDIQYINYLKSLLTSTQLSETEKVRVSRLISSLTLTKHFYSKIIKPDFLVADVGCYFGQWSLPIANSVKELSLIDIVDDRVRYLRLMINNQDNITLIKHNFVTGRLDTKKYNLILCMETLHYIRGEDRFFFLENLLKCLDDKEGYIIFDVRNAIQDYLRYRYVLKFPKSLIFFDPQILLYNLNLSLKFKDVINAIPTTLKNYVAFIVKYFLVKTSLGKRINHKFKIYLNDGTHGMHPENKISFTAEILTAFFTSRGLTICPPENVIDIQSYIAGRNIDGFAATGTFLKDYHQLLIFKK